MIFRGLGGDTVFGKKQGAGAPRLKWVDKFDAAEVKAALRGRWLTLALARFDAPFSSRLDRDYLEPPAARGVVHFDIGYDSMIPAELTFLENEPFDRARVGNARFNFYNSVGDDPAHVLLEVRISDPRGKIAAALQEAFTSAALSQARFVHVSFRREELDQDAVAGALLEKGLGGSHDLTEISFSRTTHLSTAPSWAWSWHRVD